MAIRDHLDPSVKRKLGAKKARVEAEEPVKKKRTSLGTAFLLARLAAMVLALMLLDQTMGLGVLDRLFFGDDISESDRDMILTASLYDWIDDVLIVLAVVALVGGVCGLVLAKLRGRREDSFAQLMQDAAQDEPPHSNDPSPETENVDR